MFGQKKSSVGKREEERRERKMKELQQSWMEGIFGPFMPRVAASEFAADLRVGTRPEAREIGCDLDGSLVGGEEMEEERDPAVGDSGCLGHAKEVLDAGFDPGSFTRFVIDAHIASAGDGDLFGSGAREELLLLRGESGPEGVAETVWRDGAEVLEAGQAAAECDQRAFEESLIDGFDAGFGESLGEEKDPCELCIDPGAIDEAFDAGSESMSGEQGGRLVGIGIRDLLFVDHELVEGHPLAGLDPRSRVVPDRFAAFGDAVGEEIDQPLGFDAAGDSDEGRGSARVASLPGIDGDEESRVLDDALGREGGASAVHQ